MSDDKLKEQVRAINDAKRMIQQCLELDGNEAETRRRVERIFESVMGYDVFQHLSRERAVKGAGETEHCDFSLQMEPGTDAKPIIMIELKRASVALAIKHLKQVASYAINAGCEWILLTNGIEWQLHHVAFGQPPETKLIMKWNLLQDDVKDLVGKFDVIGYKNIKKNGLSLLWQKTHVLRPLSLIKAIMSEDSLNFIRRTLKKENDVNVTPEDIVSAFRKLLNEVAAQEMEQIKICLPESVSRKRKPQEKPTEQQFSEPNTASVLSPTPTGSELESSAGVSGVEVSG
jgi:predicted type IV restriction endonuclease